MKRWKHLRDAFIKSEKKYKESKASGSEASKKKKYIFNEELQFLRKIYEERETEESYNNEKEDDNEELNAPPVPSTVPTVKETAKKFVLKTKLPTRQHKKIDEVDLKILQALDQKKPEEKNDKLSFFKSLLPHVDKFDDNQWLQCQMEFLQVISKFKNTYSSMTQTPNVHNQSTSQIQQFNQPSVNFSHIPQQAFPTNIHSSQFISTSSPAQMTCSPFAKFKPISDISQQKSSTSSHHQNYSQIISDNNVESRSSSITSFSSANTIDFTDL